MLYVGALKGSSSTLAMSFLAYKSNRSKLGLEAVNDAFMDSDLIARFAVFVGLGCFGRNGP